jgi:hypothetical protein
MIRMGMGRLSTYRKSPMDSAVTTSPKMISSLGRVSGEAAPHGEPDGADGERESRDGEEDEEGTAERPAAERLAVLEQGTDQKRDAQDGDERGDGAGEQGRADRVEAARSELRGPDQRDQGDREQGQSRDEILRPADDAPAFRGTFRNGFRFDSHAPSRKPPRPEACAADTT